MIKQLLVLMGCLILAACSQTFSLSESEVETYINEQVSFKKQEGLPGLFFIKIELGEVAVDLGRQKANAMLVTGTSSLELQNPIKPFEGQVTVSFSAVPWYHQEQGALYLKNVTLDKVESEPAELGKEFAQLVPQLSMVLQSFLQTQPVYILDESDVKQAGIKRVAKEIIIKPGKIEFVTEL